MRSGGVEDVGSEGVGGAEDDFQRAVPRAAVARLCHSAGYSSARFSALDALAELAVRYVCEVGRVAHFYANASGRTGCSVFDVLGALEDVGATGKGSTSSELRGSSANSSLIDEIAAYVASAGNAPFAGSLPRLPMLCKPKQRASFAFSGSAPPAKHIPEWLPAFPDPHTYIHTPVLNDRAANPKEGKVEQARQRRKAERSLLNLQKRLANTATKASSLHDKTESFRPPREADSGVELAATAANPPPSSPAQSEEEEAVFVPCKDGIALEMKYPVFDVFKPAIVSLSRGSVEFGNSVALPMKRPILKFNFDRKTLDANIYLGVHGSGMRSSMASGGDEKDDKKRRVQLIIGESMDNPQELHQL